MITAIDGIERVPLNSLKRYLIASGWRVRTLLSGNEIFSFGEDDGIEIVLPETETSPGISERLANAVTTLSALEERSFEEVIGAIRAISYDLVRSRLPNAIIRHDTIKLGTAEDFIRGMTKILAASAHGELHDVPYFIRPNLIAQRYAEDCLFGHTFRGSFGFTVESPVGPNTVELISDEAAAPPLERRAIRRLARGLRIIEGAISREEPEEIVKGYKDGLNANACEELAALIEPPGIGEVKFEIVFSREWGFPADLGPAPTIDIPQRVGFDVLEAAAKALRVVNYDKVRTIVGMVRTLHSMENPSDLFRITGSQDVVVEWLSEDFGRKNVRVPLGPVEYLQAVEAHKEGRAISVEGELERTGRQWRLDNPRNFS